MPSSTSSSSEGVPAAKVGASLGVALLVTLGILVAVEQFWRSRGYQPSVVDDPALWSLHRSEVEPDGIVLLGSSRMQSGLRTDFLRQTFPGRQVTMLAVVGTGPLATLKDLADDDMFRGMVICEVVEWDFLPPRAEDQKSYVNHFHNVFNMNTRLNRRCATYFQDRFVVVNPAVNLTQIATTSIQLGRPIEPPRVRMFPDRSRIIDYSHYKHPATVQQQIQGWKEMCDAVSVDADTWLQQTLAVEGWVKRIQDRGGNVVFVRFPSGKEFYNVTDQYFPRDRYWDRFAAQTCASTLHFLDIDALMHFQLRCPDGVHFGAREAELFTGVLVNRLRIDGFFEP